MSKPEQAARAVSTLVLGLLVGLYAAQSVTGSMVQTALPVVLRDMGIPLERIGFLSILFLPWALKFLWAPLVDRFGTERNWILGCQAVLILCFAVAAYLPPDTHLMALSAIFLVMALAATTQDVATDSLAVHATTPETRGKASGASTAGSYIGFVAGSGLWLPVYAYAGWAAAMWMMAGVVLILTLPTLMARRLGAGRKAQGARPRFKAVLRNRALMGGIGFMLVYQSGVRLGLAMLGPFMVDGKVPVAAIGAIQGAGAALAGLCAALVGTAIVLRLGAARSLALFAALNLLICLSLATYASGAWSGTPGIVALLLAQACLTAMSFVALYAAMMNWCGADQVATDFAILQSVDAIMAIVAGSLAGMLAQHLGYASVFGLAACLLALGAWRALARSRGFDPTRPTHTSDLSAVRT